MKKSNFIVLFLFVLLKGTTLGSSNYELPVDTNFEISQLEGSWVVSLASDYITDNYERTIFYPCHTFNFEIPSNGVLTFTESYFSPLYSQWNYYNRTKSFYYKESAPYVLYLDSQLAQPFYYAVYSDSTSVLFLSNSTCSSNQGSYTIAITKDQTSATTLYPVAQSILKKAGCIGAFENITNPNLGCTTLVNHGANQEAISLNALYGTWNVTAVWSNPPKTSWSSLQCVSFTFQKDFFMDLNFVIEYYDKDGILEKWKELEFYQAYLDPNNQAIWHRSAMPPLVVTYANITGPIQMAIIVYGSKNEAIMISNQNTATPAQLALFEANLVSVGIIANPVNIVPLTQRNCPPVPQPPYLTQSEIVRERESKFELQNAYHVSLLQHKIHHLIIFFHHFEGK